MCALHRFYPSFFTWNFALICRSFRFFFLFSLCSPASVAVFRLKRTSPVSTCTTDGFKRDR